MKFISDLKKLMIDSTLVNESLLEIYQSLNIDLKFKLESKNGRKRKKKFSREDLYVFASFFRMKTNARNSSK